MIQLQFSSQNKPGSWLIQKFTWSRFSHVDFVLPDGRLLGARGHGGVQIREPELFPTLARFDIDAPDSVLDHAMSQIGKPYDWPAILGFMAKRQWQDKNAWFCSELVAWSFQAAGVPLLRSRDLYRITPRDLLLSPYLKKHGNGSGWVDNILRGAA